MINSEKEFNKETPLRVVSLFSGIGAFEKALQRLQIPFYIVRYCEIDKYASKAYSLIHKVSEDLNLGDIQEVNAKIIPDFDLLTWGFPCTNVSVAGRQEGLIYKCMECKQKFSLSEIKGNRCPYCNSSQIKSVTQSSLYLEGLRILKEKKPVYSVIENVKALTFKRNEKTLQRILNDLDEAGYRNYYKVLNAKDFGIPQNRERIFIVSIRKDVDQNFQFPEPFDNGLRLKDFLDTDVDEKYYLKGGYLDWWLKNKDHQLRKQYSSLDADIAICLTARQYASWNGNYIQKLDKRTENIFDSLSIEDIEDKDFNIGMLTERRTEEAKKIRKEYREKYGRDFCPRRAKELTPRLDGISNCITATQTREHLLLEKNPKMQYRIRKLTPKECFKLMGFDEYDCQILMENKISDRQLYKMSGNSIVVNVLQEVFKQLFKNKYVTQK